MTRIIAGSAGGRRLATPDHGHTRPTSDRVREALFSAIVSWLGTEGDSAFEGVCFLDLYAGSGAVGLEAASRGAAPVVLVEQDGPTSRLIGSNADTLGLAARVVKGSVPTVLAGTPERRWDVIFSDPPYDVSTEQVEDDLRAILDGGWLAEDGLVIVERSSRTRDPVPVGYPTTWTRRYGETSLHFFDPREEPE